MSVQLQDLFRPVSDAVPDGAAATRRPLRLGILSEYFHPARVGGTGTVLSGLARRLRDSYGDLEIEVITSRNLYRTEGPPLAAVEEWDGIRILRLPTPRPNRRSTALRLAANTVFSQAVLLRL